MEVVERHSTPVRGLGAEAHGDRVSAGVGGADDTLR